MIGKIFSAYYQGKNQVAKLYIYICMYIKDSAIPSYLFTTPITVKGLLSRICKVLFEEEEEKEGERDGEREEEEEIHIQRTVYMRLSPDN